MKNHKLIMFLAAGSLALLSQPAHAANSTITVNASDLILGFRASGGTGSGLHLEVDLGAASNFYNAAAGSSFTLPGLTLADLTSTYGSSWNTRSDLSFGVIGTTGLSAVGAKPAKTLFASSPWASTNLTLGMQHTTPFPSPTTSFAANAPVNRVNAMLSVGSSGPGALNGQTSTANSDTAALIDSSLANSYTAEDGAGLSFGYFNPTIDQNTNIPSGGVVGVDLYDMEVGTGPGTFVGTVTISDTGVGTFTAAIPEPSTYLMFGLGAIALYGIRRSRKITV